MWPNMRQSWFETIEGSTKAKKQNKIDGEGLVAEDEV